MNETTRTTLNYAQWVAVESTSPTLLIVAGPGSGKTRVLVERIKRLISNGESANAICAISYTNAAADEIQKRVGVKLGYCGTLHGLCLRLLQQNASAVGYLPNVSVIGESAENAIFEQGLAKMKYRGSMQELHMAIVAGPYAKNTTSAGLVAKDFWQTLLRNNLVTCDGLLHYGAALAPNAQTPFKHLFVDECQDAGPLDARIYENIDIPNKCFLGDSDQAIFGFRGGSPAFMLNMAQYNCVQIVKLESNYRSDRAICEAANALISHNKERIAKDILPASEAAGRVNVRSFPTPSAEMAWIDRAMETGGAQLSTRSKGESCAILCRNNREAKAIAEYLTGLGVQVATRQSVKLPEQFEQALTFIAFIGDPDNDMLAYWTMCQKDKVAANAAKLKAASQGKSINQCCGNLPKAGVSDVVLALETSGYGADMIEYVRTTMAKTPCETMGDLILALRAGVQKSEGEGVYVGTIHSAKGREWDTVFLPSFEDEIIPGHDYDVEEQRRLAFVATTRARHNVYVSWCEKRVSEWGSMTPQPRTPSRFIAELKG